MVNLLKDPRRRPIEVDAREFRVLAQQLILTTDTPDTQLKQHTFRHKHSSPPNHNPPPLVNGGGGDRRSGSGRRKPNGHVTKSRSRSSDRVFEADSHAKAPSSSVGCVVVERSQKKPAGDSVFIGCGDDIMEGVAAVGPSKPGRRSRRENFELESLQAMPAALPHQQQQQQLSVKRASNSSSPAVAAGSSTGREPQAEYTADEKEWLKEKLLEEFERQEFANKKSSTSSSSGGRARKNKAHLATKTEPASSYSPPGHQHHHHHAVEVNSSLATAVPAGEADRHQLTGGGRSGNGGSLCRDTIAEMTSGLVEHYFLRAIPAQPAAAAAKLPAVIVAKGGNNNNSEVGGTVASSGHNHHHHHHHQASNNTTAGRRKECCVGLSNSTIDEMVTKSAVATTTTTLFLSEQHHNSSGGCDGGGCHSGQLDQLRSAAYWTSLTHLEGGGGCPPDSQGRLSTTMPRENVVMLPEKTVSPSLHASLPRPARQSHSESCRASTVSMPGSPPPYVHPKSQEKDCSCPCDCRSSAYPSQEVSKLSVNSVHTSGKLSTL